MHRAIGEAQHAEGADEPPGGAQLKRVLGQDQDASLRIAGGELRQQIEAPSTALELGPRIGNEVTNLPCGARQQGNRRTGRPLQVGLGSGEVRPGLHQRRLGVDRCLMEWGKVASLDAHAPRGGGKVGDRVDQHTTGLDTLATCIGGVVHGLDRASQQRNGSEKAERKAVHGAAGCPQVGLDLRQTIGGGLVVAGQDRVPNEEQLVASGEKLMPGVTHGACDEHPQEPEEHRGNHDPRAGQITPYHCGAVRARSFRALTFRARSFRGRSFRIRWTWPSGHGFTVSHAGAGTGRRTLLCHMQFCSVGPDSSGPTSPEGSPPTGA